MPPSVWKIAIGFLVLATLPVSGASTGEPSEAEAQILKLTNQERKLRNLPPLVWDNRLGRAAQKHAANMLSQKRLSHTLSGKGPGDRLRAEGYKGSRWSENIYYASGGSYATPAGAMDGWMNSSGHRANILDRQVTQIGVGVAKDSRGRWYACQDFGRP